MQSPSDLQPGERIAHRYVVVRKLGRGGLGTTYLVDDSAVGGPVALKVLHHQAPERVAALRREFELLRGLVHPHLARVHDFGTVRTGPALLPFYTATWTDGVPLDRFAHGKRWADVRPAVDTALHALSFLHRANIRHGDFKPDNILVRTDATSTVIDLSCSQPLGADPLELSGTPGFLAPELLDGKGGDGRADIFAVGVTVQRVLESLREPAPVRVQNLFARCQAPSPADRPASVSLILSELGVSTAQSRAPLASPAALIGRSAAWQSLSHALDQIIEARPGPRALCVTGPEGVGRTRVLQELKWQAQLRCHLVEGFSHLPRPIASMLERALDGASVRPGVAGVWQAREALVGRSTPIVLLFDDAHLLAPSELELLRGLARLLEPTDPVMLVWSSIELPGEPVVNEIRLDALTQQDVATWCGGLVSPPMVRHVVQLTGGYPSALQALLSQISAGGLTEHDLPRLRSAGSLSTRRSAQVRALPDPAQRALATVAITSGEVEDAVLPLVGVTAAGVAEIVRLGLVVRATTGWKLARAMEADAIIEAVGPELVAGAHEKLAMHLHERADRATKDSRERSELQARRIVHLVRAGRLQDATAAFIHERAWQQLAPGAWADAADCLASVAVDSHVVLLAAETSLEGGRPERALKLLAALAKQPLSAKERVMLSVGRASAFLSQGKSEETLGELEGSTYEAPDLRDRVAVLRARAWLHRGNYEQATNIARSALDAGPEPQAHAALLDVLGVAAAYLGNTQEAQSHLLEAASMHAQAQRPLAHLRTLSYQAFNAYRAGDSLQAAHAYRQARDVASEHGLSDKLAYAELNLGAASHQNGDWGVALACYERALGFAKTMGQQSAQLQVRFNLAKLHADIGLPDLAEAVAEGGERAARDEGLDFFASAFQSLAGEIALLRHAHDTAIELLELARQGFERDGARREEAEVLLQLAQAWTEHGDLDRARQAVSQAQDTARSLGARDLAAACLIGLGFVHLAAPSPGDAVRAFDEAALLAAELKRFALEADARIGLARAWEGQKATSLQAKEVTRARELLERIAATLPDDAREAFWRHPRRKLAVLLVGPSRHDSALVHKLRRLLDINAKINSSLRTREVLDRTMDAAIELAGAERGFLIVRTGGPADEKLTVPVARNLDREKIGKSHLKFSRGIAEQCIASGEPITTVDARSDGRFMGNESVHAMRLKSVVCVPIRSPQGVLGALYLDNRFHRGEFDREDIDLLLAFADQAAIALGNARLHDQLRERTRELELERRRVEELMQAQAQRIDRLTDEVRAKQEVLEHRYDYGNILGRSRAMQAVFGLLDRVIDTDAPVLIQGESGTGKELIARAIHFNGRRREQPFVALNCAAFQPQLLESELFGHVRGAFTGADRDREGLLVAAKGGTLFLDEMGDMPLEMQAKLLRALQEGEVRPVGATRVLKTSFRFVSATNRRLRDEVAAGRFREDLFYRIGVVEVTLPPLRERREDLPLLVQHLLKRHAQEMGLPVPKMDRSAHELLMRHPWPGNVRELENALIHAMLMATGASLCAQDFSLPTHRPTREPRIGNRRQYELAEESRIREALLVSRWNVSQVAREMGISRPTLYRKMRKLGIEER